MLDYEIYSECDQINDLIEKRDMATARCKVINLLDRMQQDGNQYNPMVNHFIRVVGLFPYIDKRQHHGTIKSWSRHSKQMLAIKHP